MERFRNILVGVDISEADQYVTNEPANPSKAAIDRALWLAKANAARVSFMYVLDPSAIQVPADGQQRSEAFRDRAALTSDAEEVLSRLVDDARRQGVVAEHRVTVGKSWIELIRQVLKHDHDVLIAGTRRFGMFRSMLFGSTGIKLLRNCPCPVWITQPPGQQIGTVLVAHDLRGVGDQAMELGCSIAQSHHAQLHVFHAVQLPEMDNMLPSGVSSDDIAQYRADATRHISQQLAPFQFSKAPDIHLAFGAAYLEILKLVDTHKVDLLVMGTVGRTGVAGFITGNTAELLLPHIPCSLIAVKPTGFKSPVTLQ